MDETLNDKAQYYLNLARKSGIGKFKIYIGMSAGVGKTYRMLQEAQSMIRAGKNVKIGLVETHGRKETEAMLEGLPIIPRREVFYTGKKLDELDVNALLILHPDWVVVDELAHSNIPGSKNQNRWQDVLDLLQAGINVITAVNIQHIERLTKKSGKSPVWKSKNVCPTASFAWPMKWST